MFSNFIIFLFVFPTMNSTPLSKELIQFRKDYRTCEHLDVPLKEHRSLIDKTQLTCITLATILEHPQRESSRVFRARKKTFHAALQHLTAMNYELCKVPVHEDTREEATQEAAPPIILKETPKKPRAKKPRVEKPVTPIKHE